MQEGHVTVDAVEESCILVGVITSEIDEVIANTVITDSSTDSRWRSATLLERYFIPRNQFCTTPCLNGISTQRSEMSARASTNKTRAR